MGVIEWAQSLRHRLIVLSCFYSWKIVKIIVSPIKVNIHVFDYSHIYFNSPQSELIYRVPRMTTLPVSFYQDLLNKDTSLSVIQPLKTGHFAFMLHIYIYIYIYIYII